MKKLILILVLIYMFFGTIHAQQFLIDGRVGYGIARGPVEKYTGTSINISSGINIQGITLKLHYNHMSGNADYGTLYSKDTPSVPVIDKYPDNYPLRAFLNEDFRETKVGIYQFDPSFSFYISNQAGLSTGYSIPLKINKKLFYVRPSLQATYTLVAENFIYDTRKLNVETSFMSGNYVEVNYLIFAHLKYADFGYGFNIPLSYEVNPQFEIVADYTYHRTFKRLLSQNFGLGILSKF